MLATIPKRSHKKKPAPEIIPPYPPPPPPPPAPVDAAPLEIEIDDEPVDRPSTDELLEEILATLAARPATPPPPPPPPPPAVDLAGVVAAALERQAQTFAAMLERLAPRSDGLGSLKEVGALFAIFIDMQKNLGDAARGPADDDEPVDRMEIFREGVKFANEFGGTQREAGAMDLALKFLESPLAEQFFGARGVATAALASSGAGNGPRPADATPAAAPPLASYAQAMTANLLGFATHNVELERAKNWIFENIPPVLVKQFAKQPDILDQIVTGTPALALHVDYVRALRDTILDELEENEGGPHAAGDATDDKVAATG
jgi:hypothetical protein